MQVTAIKTHKIVAGESIFKLLDTYVKKVCENDIIAIASKIVSLCEKRIAKKILNKKKLLACEADFCFAAPEGASDFCLTLIHNRLLPNAGIDESNCKNAFVLLPKDPQLSAKRIWQYLRKRDRIRNLGIIITDSNITPLRQGVTGVGIGWCGFEPTYNYIGEKDIFGRNLKVTQINLLDSLATVATLASGEGNEQTPIAIIKNVKKIKFQSHAPTKADEKKALIKVNRDLFWPLLQTQTKNTFSPR